MRNPHPGAVLATVEAKILMLIFFQNERTQSTRFDTKLMFGVFKKSRFRYSKLVRNSPPRAILAMVEAKKLADDFSKMNAAPYLTQNSCLVRFRSFGFGR
jgi:hypothetical protein